MTWILYFISLKYYLELSRHGSPKLMEELPPPVPRHLRFATARSLMVYCSSDSLPGSVHAKDTKEQIINRLHDVTDLTLSGKKNIRKSEVTRAEICFPFSWSELFGSDLRLLYSTQNQRCLDLSWSRRGNRNLPKTLFMKRSRKVRSSFILCTCHWLEMPAPDHSM